jgi:anthranilate synthase/aminodeoxychorismate synthase-like glutamine amidotransferase
MLNLALIDNFDSFTHNLAHYLEPYCKTLSIFRVNQAQATQLDHFDAIVISPGPGLPKDYPNLKIIFDKYANHKPILGVCLGLQTVWQFYGGKLKNLNQVLHGVSVKAQIKNSTDPILLEIPKIFETGRYHSWAGDIRFTPKNIKILAADFDENPMIIKHSSLPIYGFQFHPESILTPEGKQFIKNWINTIKLRVEPEKNLINAV